MFYAESKGARANIFTIQTHLVSPPCLSRVRHSLGLVRIQSHFLWPNDLVRSALLAPKVVTNSRIAQRFKRQIFVSVDVSVSQKTGGKNPIVALAVEKAIVASLKALDGPNAE